MSEVSIFPSHFCHHFLHLIILSHQLCSSLQMLLSIGLSLSFHLLDLSLWLPRCPRFITPVVLSLSLCHRFKQHKDSRNISSAGCRRVRAMCSYQVSTFRSTPSHALAPSSFPSFHSPLQKSTKFATNTTHDNIQDVRRQKASFHFNVFAFICVFRCCQNQMLLLLHWDIKGCSKASKQKSLRWGL